MTWSDSILTGFFTGIGVITGQWVFEKYLKPRLDGIHKRTRHFNLLGLEIRRKRR